MLPAGAVAPIGQAEHAALDVAAREGEYVSVHTSSNTHQSFSRNISLPVLVELHRVYEAHEHAHAHAHAHAHD